MRMRFAIASSLGDKDGLLELASKLRPAIEAWQIGVWEFDERTGRVHWDERMFEIYCIDDGLNIRPADFGERHIHPEDLDAMVAYADECKERNSDFRHDFRIVRKDGAIRHIRSMARSVLTYGEASRLIGVNIEVTEDCLRAEELQKAQRQLKNEARQDTFTGLGNRRRLDEMTPALFNGPT